MTNYDYGETRRRSTFNRFKIKWNTYENGYDNAKDLQHQTGLKSRGDQHRPYEIRQYYRYCAATTAYQTHLYKYAYISIHERKSSDQGNIRNY